MVTFVSINGRFNTIETVPTEVNAPATHGCLLNVFHNYILPTEVNAPAAHGCLLNVFHNYILPTEVNAPATHGFYYYY